MTEEKLTDKMDRLLTKLDEDKNTNGFKLPWGIKLGLGKTLKKNYAIVFFIRTNSSMDIKLLPIEDDTIMFNEQIYSATSSFVMRYKKYPVLIIPEWNSVPFSPAENYERAEREKTLTAGQKYIMTKMRLDAIKPKMNLNIKTIVVIIAVLGIGYYILQSLGVF